MTKEDWLDWKQSPVTKLFFESVVYRREDIKEVLVKQAGKDPVDDSALRGYSQAMEDVLNTEFDEVDMDFEEN